VIVVKQSDQLVSYIIARTN